MSDISVSSAYNANMMGNGSEPILVETTKTPEGNKLAFFGQKGSVGSKIPAYLLSAAINFFILGFIFVATLAAKYKALLAAGDQAYVSYMKSAFLKGLGFALIAAVTIFVIDIISGGFASLVMVPVYVLAGIATLILSLIAPPFLQDVTETRNGVQVSRISGYKLWSVSFWPLFVVGMLVALSLGAFASYIGNKLSTVVIDTINSITNRGLSNADFGSLFRLI